MGVGGQTCVEVDHRADVAVLEMHHHADLLDLERALAEVVHDLSAKLNEESVLSIQAHHGCDRLQVWTAGARQSRTEGSPSRALRLRLGKRGILARRDPSSAADNTPKMPFQTER